jgi:hypothetical protein
LSGKPSFGDLVHVSNGEEIIARGAVKVTPSNVSPGYGIDTTYAPSFGEPYLSGVEAEQVELAKGGECWGQHWQKRVFGH